MGKASRLKRQTRLQMRQMDGSVIKEKPFAKFALEACEANHREEMELIDTLRMRKKSDQLSHWPWPDSVYVPSLLAMIFVNPMARAMPIHRAVGEDGQPTGELQLVTRSYQATAEKLCYMTAWRTSQGIYKFDETLGKQLFGMPVDGAMPADVLRRLPAWCVYCQVPLDIDDVNGAMRALKGRFGFFAHYDHVEIYADIPRIRSDSNGASLVEALVLVPTLDKRGLNEVDAMVLEGMLEKRIAIPLLDGFSIEECIDIGMNDVYGVTGTGWAREKWKSGRKRDAGRGLASALVNCVLFLCCEEPEVEGDHQPASRSAPKRGGIGSRLEVKEWEVGYRSGAELRAAMERDQLEGCSQKDGMGTTTRPKPHVRRHHYHGYWEGSAEKGTRRYKVVWLRQMLINAKCAADIPSVTRNVSRPLHGSPLGRTLDK